VLILLLGRFKRSLMLVLQSTGLRYIIYFLGMFDLGKLKKFMPLSSKIRANSHFIIFTGFFVLHLLL